MCVMSEGGDGVMQGGQFGANSEYKYNHWAAVIFHEAVGPVRPEVWCHSQLGSNTIDFELL